MGFLEVYRQRSPERNKYDYSAGAFDVFHRIAELKRQGRNRRHIKAALLVSGLGQLAQAEEEGRKEEGSSAGTPRRPTGAPGDATAAWIDALQAASGQTVQALRDALAAKDAVIEASEAELTGLRERLLALPDGRAPEDIAAALAEKERQDAELTRLASSLAAMQGRAMPAARCSPPLKSSPGGAEAERGRRSWSR